jgi:hypothetical protein
MENQPGTALHVFGQTWRFTPQALSALGSIWVGTQATLKTLVINISAIKGFDMDGDYTCDYFGVKLQIARNGQFVVVDALG